MVVFRGFVDAASGASASAAAASASASAGAGGGGGAASLLPRTRLKMGTDARSSKVMHEGEHCELCWWFGRTSEQFRVRGRLQYVGAGERPAGVDADEWAFLSGQRTEQWGKMRDAARAQFFWDSPGAVFSGAIDGGEVDSDDEDAAAGPAPAGAAAAAAADDDERLRSPPANFLLMLLDPVRVDHLSLRTDVRIVDELVPADGGGDAGTRTWRTYRVNP